MINKKMKKRLKNEIFKKFKEIYSNNDFMDSLNVKEKKDKSFVTEVDLYISNLVKNEMKKYESLKGVSFYSEEDLECFELPCLVLDPIDGTAGLVKGTSECVVSLAILNTTFNASSGWLYNPFTGFEISTEDIFTKALKIVEQRTLVGMVSRSDFNRGFFKEIQKDLIYLYPKGSIAYKLGLLAAGACDFVVSLTPKNVWDIAAGTVILHQRGYRLYQKGREVSQLNEVRLEGDLLWCFPCQLDRIRLNFDLD